MPPKTAVPKMARGMSRVGLVVSSPKVEAASNPAKDRKPNTTARNRGEKLVPAGGANTLSVKWCPPGAAPASRNGAHDGGCGQAPTELRKAVPKMPAAEDVTTA